MKRHLGLALGAAAALAVGVALAQPQGPLAAAPQEPSAIDRLIAVEKRLNQLQTQVDALVKAAARGAGPAATAEEPQTAELRQQMDEVLAYLAAQSEGAARLQQALDDSREKGFTYGINPDSRIVLLEGFGQFTTGLQTDVPQAAKPAEENASAQR